MGFFSQCEKKHNYFVHGHIRLQLQQAYACIVELQLINTFLHAISHSCMNGVKHILDEFESAYMYMHAARGLLFHCCLMHRIQETTIMQ